MSNMTDDARVTFAAGLFGTQNLVLTCGTHPLYADAGFLPVSIVMPLEHFEREPIVCWGAMHEMLADAALKRLDRPAPTDAEKQCASLSAWARSWNARNGVLKRGWPYDGHIPGCEGNCDGACEGSARVFLAAALSAVEYMGDWRGRAHDRCVRYESCEAAPESSPCEHEFARNPHVHCFKE